MKLFCLILGVVFLPLAAPCFAQSVGSGAAVIIAKDGQSRVVVRGGEFDAGETIDTADGRVQLRFLDGASMSLQPATRFRIEDFHFAVQDGKASGDDRGIFSLIKGLVEVCSGAGCLQVGPGEVAIVSTHDSRPLLQGRLDGALDGSAVPGLPSSPVLSPEVVVPVVAPTRTMSSP